MHEFGIGEHLVQEIVRHVATAGDGGRVARLHLRHGIAVHAEALRQACEVQSRGTALEGAELVLEEKIPSCSCACGHSQPLHHDDLVGHMFICPGCAKVHPVPGCHNVDVLEIEWSPGRPGAAAVPDPR